MDLVIWQQWKDPRLSHSLNYTITLPADSKKLIWLPDTVFLNVRSATIHDVISENSKVSINPEGLVTYSARYVFRNTSFQANNTNQSISNVFMMYWMGYLLSPPQRLLQYIKTGEREKKQGK